MCSRQNRYPLLEVDLDKLQENLAALVQRCQASSVAVAGVVKGFTALPEMVEVFARSGCRYVASSRVEQLRRIREAGIRAPLMLIRIPMLSELDEAAELADLSLHSELSVLRAFNEAAGRAGRRRKVILMADLGDLREGFWDKDELLEAALEVERRLPNLELAGVGTNLGCYGSVRATPAKMEELLAIARRVEAAIGRPLEFVSGGASTSVPMVLRGELPAGINLLRLGESIILGYLWEQHMDFMHQDVFTLKAEVVEVKAKPSYPVGELTVDAFGRTPSYEDRGIRTRALLALGRVDYGDPFDLKPRLPGVEVMGASSDHTILDVEDVPGGVKVGDILEFDLCYATMVYLTNTESVRVVFKHGKHGKNG